MTPRLGHTAPVFTLHASASGPSQWLQLTEDLAARHHVTAVDLRERVVAPETGVERTRLSDVAEFVVPQLEAAGEPVHLVGHSFGAAVALKIALMRPDLVTSLTLFEPAAFFLTDHSDPDEAHEINALEGLRDDIRDTLNAGRPDVGMRRFLAFWNGADRWDTMGKRTRERLSNGASAVLADFAAAFSEDMAVEDLAEINVPTLILSGMESQLITQRIAARVAAATPEARLALLPALGHMAPLTDPEWVNPRICQHIAEVERNAARVCWPTRLAA